MSCGIGLTAGPVIGSILYDIGGYMTPFIAFCVVQATFGLLTKFIIPSSIDFKTHEILDKLGDDQVSNNEEISDDLVPNYTPKEFVSEN